MVFLPAFAQADVNKITHLYLSKGNTSVRIELIQNKILSYHVFTLSHPNRLIVDLPDTRLAADLTRIPIEHSLVKGLRHGKMGSASLRLVFELKAPIHFKTFRVGKKIAIDLYAETPTLTKVANPMVIVLDPGHGGKDCGAIGVYGTKEKTVVLAIAKRLAKLINADPTMRAVLTRNDDHFIPLVRRLKLARKGKADLFVAIHADSFFNDQSSGASVYALSEHGTTSVAARWLSDRENHSELGQLDLRELGDQSVQLRSVLIDLAQTATITDSLRLGSSILDALDDITNLHYTRVEQAPFLVLKSPDIPSILVETGFLSNPKEEEKLRDPVYQTKIAQALFNGIRLYLKKYYVART